MGSMFKIRRKKKSSKYGCDKSKRGSKRRYGSKRRRYGSKRRRYGSKRRRYGSKRRRYGSKRRRYGSKRRFGKMANLNRIMGNYTPANMNTFQEYTGMGNEQRSTHMTGIPNNLRANFYV